MDWVAIVAACGLAGAVGVGFVLWERYEERRLARQRVRQRRSRRLVRRRPAPLDVDRWAA